MLSKLKGYGPSGDNFYWVNSNDPESAKKMLKFLKEKVEEIEEK
jgi:hypothetical protein